MKKKTTYFLLLTIFLVVGFMVPQSAHAQNPTWTVSYDTPESQIRSFAIDTSNNVIYTGSNNSASIYRCPTSSGCNSASDWSVSYDTPESVVTSLIFDSNNNVLYAGTAPNGLIYRCPTSSGCNSASDWSVSYDTPMFALRTFAFDSTNNVIYAAAGGGGSSFIYRCPTSSGCNSASDWSVSYNAPLEIISLLVDKASGVIYAGSSYSSGDGNIYRCVISSGCDASSDWAISYDTSETGIDSLVIDSTSSVIYAGSKGSGLIYRCPTSSGCDSASDWSVSFDTPEADIVALVFDGENNAIYAGSAGTGKIYRCPTSSGCDSASDWSVSFDPSENTIWSLIFDSTNNTVYAGSNPSGIIYRGSPALPDLTADKPSEPISGATFTTADTFTLKADVLNDITAGNAVGTFNNKIQYDLNNDGSYEDTVPGAVVSVTDLDAGSSKTVSFLIDASFFPVGTHGLRMCADLPSIPPGDPNGEIAESIDGEFGNNCGQYIVVNIIAAPPPPPTVDLKIDGSSGPNSYTDPAGYTLSWTTTGSPTICTASGAWSGSKAVGSGSQSFSGISAGSYPYTITCTNATGSHVDSVTANVSVPALPDLTITSPITQSIPSPIPSGSNVVFTQDVVNQGSVPAGGAFDTLVQIAVNNSDPNYTGSFLATPQLPDLVDSNTATVSYTWNNIPAGTHDIRFCADSTPPSPSTGVIDEGANENNNCGAPLTITVDPPPPPLEPDLITENLSDSGAVTEGNPITFTGDVRNMGDAVAGAGVSWSQVGNSLSISGIGDPPALAALNSTDVAYVDPENEELRTYRFDGTNWSQVGNGLNVITLQSGDPVLAALSSTDVAFIDDINDDLRVYRFDGTNWSQVGNDLNILTADPALVALNSTDVAFVENFSDELRVYRFDGTNWSQVGNDLFIPGLTGVVALAALNSTDVAYLDSFSKDLRVYRFDGTNWTQVGNDLNIPGIGDMALAALNSTDVAFVENFSDELRVYRFDGTNWSQVGSGLNILGVQSAALTALNTTDVAFIDNFLDELRTYSLSNPSTSRFCIDDTAASCLDDTSAIILSPEPTTGALAAGDFETKNANFTIPLGWAGTSHTAYFCADVDDVVAESSEGAASNCSSRSFNVDAAAGQPDLTADTPTNTSPLVEGNISFSGNIINNGPVAAGGSFDNLFRVALDFNLDPGYPVTPVYDDIALAAPLLPDLAGGGASLPVSFTYNLPVGTHAVSLCADFDTLWNDDIDEGINEGNNCGGFIEVTVVAGAPPPPPPPTVDLKIDSSDGPNSYTDPASYTLSWTTTNNPIDCIASGNWLGNKNVAGGNQNFSSIPVNSYTYILDCFNGPPTTNPTQIGSVSFPKAVHGMDLFGNYAYVMGGKFANPPGYFEIIDISNPMNPTKMGEIATPESLWGDVVILGNYAYVAIGHTSSFTNYLKIYNILDPNNPVEVGSVVARPYTQDLVLRGNYVYTYNISAEDVEIFDISSPTNPIKVGGFDAGNSSALDISGNYLYVGTGNNFGFKIYDLTNPTSPALIGTAVGTSYATSLTVSNSFVYIGTRGDGNGIEIFDVSNKASPTLVGSWTGFTASLNVHRIVITGNYAHVVADKTVGEGYYEIFDISNPANIINVGSNNSGGAGTDVIISGGYVYVVSTNSDLRIFANRATDSVVANVSAAAGQPDLTADTPTNTSPLVEGNISFSGNIINNGPVAAGGSFDNLFRVALDFNLDPGYPVTPVYDDIALAAPLLPDLAGGGASLPVSFTYNLPVGTHAVSLCADFDTLWNDDIDEGINEGNNCGGFIEITVVAGAPPPPPPPTVELKIDGSDGPNSYTDPANYTLSWTTTNNPVDCIASGAWTGNKNTAGDSESQGPNPANTYTYILECFNGPPTSAAERVGEALTDGGPNGVAVSGNYAYVGSTLTGDEFEVFDITDPSNPTEVASIPLSTNRIYNIALFGSYAYLAANTGLEIIDISNPLIPVRVGGVDTSVLPSGAQDITIVGGLAYVANAVGSPTYNGTLFIFDLSSPTSPNKIGEAPAINSAFSVAVSGSYAYVVGYQSSTDIGYLQIFDISNPNTPAPTGNTITVGEAEDVAVSGNYAYVVGGMGNNLVPITEDLEIFDVSNPATPFKILGSGVNTFGSDPKSIAYYNNYIYVANNASGPNGLEIYDVSTPSSPVKVGSGSVPAGSSVTNIAIVDGYVYMTNARFYIFANRATDSVVANVTAAAPLGSCDLNTVSYDGVNATVGAEDPNPVGITFKDDGTRMYMMGFSAVSGHTVYQYSLSSAWDISTASYGGSSKDVGAEDVSARDVAFKFDGTKMYIVGSNSDAVYQYTLSTPWDVSTASYDSVSKYLGTEDSNPFDIFFKSNGVKMYVVGGSNDRVFQYTLSTPWDIGTASYDFVSKDVSAEDTIPLGITFEDAGSKMYMVGNANMTVYQYSLSTPWDIGTASYDFVSKDVSAAGANPSSVAFKPDGTNMYVLGNLANRVYQYSCGGAPALPDLTADTPTNTTPLVEGNISFSGNIINNGPATAGGSFDNLFRVALDYDPINDPTYPIPTYDDRVLATPLLPDLAGSGASLPVSFTYNLPVGTHAVSLCADFDISWNDDIVELNEGNNCGGFIEITVVAAGGPPVVDLKIDGSDGPVSYTDTDTYNVEWSTGNSPSDCIASGDWFGSKNISGGFESQGPNPANTYTYILECFNGPPTNASAKIGEALVGSYAKDIAVSGNYAYVASWGTGAPDTLEVYDISDNTSPFKVWGGNSAGGPNGITIANNYMYVVSNSAGNDLEIFDLTVPGSPVWKGGVDSGIIGDNHYNVVVSGDYAYVVSRNTGDGIGFDIYNITDPETPTWVGGAPTANSAKDIAISGSYAYIVTMSTAAPGLEVFDISDPTDPRNVGNASVSSDAGTIAVLGSYAYVGSEFSGDELEIFNISDPTIDPIFVKGIETGRRIDDIVFSNGYAYIANGGGAFDFFIYDVSDPENPSFVDAVPTNDHTRGIAVSNGYVYTVGEKPSADPGSKLEIFANRATDSVVANVTATAPLASCDLSTVTYDSVFKNMSTEAITAHSITFKPDGTRVYVIGTTNDRVHQYTLSTPWNVGTASYDSVFKYVGSEDIGAEGIAFSADGTKMYTVGDDTFSVYQYTLSTAWNVGTASYDFVSTYVGAEDGNVADVILNTDGTKMYMLGQNNHSVYQYTLSTPWNVGTASYDSVFKYVGSEDTDIGDIIFTSDGAKMYVSGGLNDSVYQYTLSTAWNVGTANYDSVSAYIGGESTSPEGLAFSSDYTKMYILDSNMSIAYQYSCGGVPPPGDPDLTVVGNGNMQVPVGLIAGDPATFQADVLNLGPGSVTGSFDNLYRVYVNYVAGSPPTFDYIELIEAPSSITNLAATFSKPTSPSNTWSTVAGTHAVDICADNDSAWADTIFESLPLDPPENNNCGVPFEFTVASPGPIPLDLISGEPWISTGGATPVQDSSVRFRGVVTNLGTEKTPPSGFLNRFRVYINYDSAGPTFDSIVNLDGGSAINGPIKECCTGNTKTTQESPVWNAIWTPSINRHAVQLCADIPGNFIPEGVGEGNNCGPLLVFNTQPAPPEPTISQSIPATDQGDPYDIWWGSTYADSCEIFKQVPTLGPVLWKTGISSVPITENESIIGDYIYTNTCSGPGNSPQSATLTHIVQPPSPPEAFITQSIFFTDQGDPVTITWDSNFADSCLVEEHFDDGTGWGPWASVVWASGLSGNATINPDVIGQYEWRNTCTNILGSDTAIIVPPHDVDPKQPLFDITLPDLTPFTAINEGDDIRIRWTCYFSSFGAAPYSTGTLFSTSGTITGDIWPITGPALPGPYDYQLDCKNTGFRQQTVIVREPTLDFTANPALIQPGDNSNIEWNVSGVNSCSISGPNGFSFLSGDISGGGTWSDSQTVINIVEQSVYTLTCQTNLRPIEKIVTVNINPNYQEF